MPLQITTKSALNHPPPLPHPSSKDSNSGTTAAQGSARSISLHKKISSHQVTKTLENCGIMGKKINIEE